VYGVAYILTPSCFRVIGYLVEPEEVTSYGREIYELVGNGTVNIRVHQEYPFTAQGAQDAHSDLESGKTTGKLVVKVADQ
jgi:NADPH2:quinone reductase